MVGMDSNALSSDMRDYYDPDKVQKRYNNLEGNVVLIDLEKGDEGLGLSLAGHRDRTQMAVFVCGLNPSGKAYKDGRIMVGDEVLEVNGNVIQGRSHLNASSIFKGIPGPSIKVIIRRSKSGMHDMAVRPITQFPITLQDETPEEKYGSYKGLTNFIMKKVHGGGLGIMIIEGKHAEYGQGIFISDLQDESVAAQAGLQVGDMILCVNKEEMIGIDYESAANILKRTEGVINMWVANPTRVPGATTPSPAETSSTLPPPGTPAKCPSSPSKVADTKPDVPPKPTVPPKPSISAKPSTATSHSISTINTTTIAPVFTSTTLTTSTTMLHHNYNQISTKIASTSSVLNSGSDDNPADPSSAEIKPGKETTIEIVKEKMGLGLSIVGRSDTLLGAIIIHEVYPDGAAAKDGRLKPGDQILEVNAEDFRTVTHQKALSVLRQTPSKVKMVVYREEGSQKEEDMYDVINVQLTKKSGKGLGLSIVGRKNGPGVFISDLVPGGVAESDGRLMHGDQILDVNSTALRNASQEQAAAILKCAPASVNMKVGRLKPGKKVATNSRK